MCLGELEGQGFIATSCTEMRVPQDEERQMGMPSRRQQFRVAAENPRKVKVVKNLLEQEAGHHMIIGEFLSQLEELSNTNYR